MTTGPASVRTYVCPHCGYDVSQTLRDRIGTCPECGGLVNERLCSLMPARIRFALRASVLIPTVAYIASLPLEAGVRRALGPLASAGFPVVCYSVAIVLLYAVAKATYARFDPRNARICAIQLAATAFVASLLLAFLVIFLIGFLGALVLSAST